MPHHAYRIVVIVAEIEVHIHQGSKVFVFAGYLAPENNWQAFSQHWRATLDQDAIKVFDASDCNAREGEFSKFKDDIDGRNALVERLLSPLVKMKNIVPFYSGVVMEDFDKLLRPNLTPQNRNPYYFCMMNVLADMAIALDMNAIPESETIACIFDRQKQFSERALTLFDEIVDGEIGKPHELDPRIRLRFDSIAFGSKKRFLPLQLAGALAYDVYHEFNRRCFSPEKEPRPSFPALTVNDRNEIVQFTGQLWDREFIGRMLSEGRLGARQN